MYAEHTHDDLNQKVCLECNRQFTGIAVACPHDGTLLVNVVQDPLIGTTLAGNYEIIEVIGHGGMGVVYKARHALMDRIVAIKMLQANLISDSMSVKRFQQESKAASRISHPHVITVYDFGISPQGQPYIVMDFLQGVALSDVIKDDGQVSVERTIKILSQACDALDHAHKQGVVHRDLKPTNIVLINYDDDQDFVKVVDFGVAKLMEQSGAEGQRLTQAGEVCGSPVYMSPEQCTGLELDARSDIYSMGIVVYETLTGKLPLLGKTMVETMSKHISDMPAPFSTARPDLYIPERLEAVVFKAMAKDPADRHQSMEELKNDLELAIPRPGKSQVLRSAVHIPQADTVAGALKKTPIWLWACVMVIAVGGMFAGFTIVRNNAMKADVHVPAKPLTDETAAHSTGTAAAPSGEHGATAAGGENTREGATAAGDKNEGKTAKPETTASSETTATKPVKPQPRHSFKNASSPEEIVERAHQEKPKPVVHHNKAIRAASQSHASAARPKSGGGSSNDRFQNLLKMRGY